MTIITEVNWPGLPKWPGVFITGKPVTPEQAKEIIMRTDTSVASMNEYSIGGNDHTFKQHCIQKFGWDAMIVYEQNFYDRKLPPNSPHPHDILVEWREAMEYVYTEYVFNSWMSTSYVGGPCGWCSPSGEIFFAHHNYGKWPSIGEIVEDWKSLLEAFPYIDVVCTLYNAESCEPDAQPLVTITVNSSAGVIVNAPDLSLHETTNRIRREMENGTRDADETSRIMQLMRGSYKRERAWPPQWIEEYGVKSNEALQRVAPFLFDVVEVSDQ